MFIACTFNLITQQGRIMVLYRYCKKSQLTQAWLSIVEGHSCQSVDDAAVNHRMTQLSISGGCSCQSLGDPAVNHRGMQLSITGGIRCSPLTTQTPSQLLTTDWHLRTSDETTDIGVSGHRSGRKLLRPHLSALGCYQHQTPITGRKQNNCFLISDCKSLCTEAQRAILNTSCSTFAHECRPRHPRSVANLTIRWIRAINVTLHTHNWCLFKCR